MSGYHVGISVTDWNRIVAGLNGKCSKLCYYCKRTWGQIATGTVHMGVNEEKGRKSCDMQHIFWCDECELKKQVS